MQAFNRGAQDNSNHIYVIYNINNYTRFLVECQVWPGALPTKKTFAGMPPCHQTKNTKGNIALLYCSFKTANV